MTTLRQAAQQALEALEAIRRSVQSDHQAEIAEDAITALRTALAQQAEPPPEWLLIKNILDEYGLDAIAFVAEFKAAQRPWVGLTDEEIEAVVEQVANGKLVGTVQEFRIRFSRAIEAKLKEKNDH